MGVGERKTGEKLEIRITKTWQGRGERHLEEPTHRMKEDRQEFLKKSREVWFSVLFFSDSILLFLLLLLLLYICFFDPMIQLRQLAQLSLGIPTSFITRSFKGMATLADFTLIFPLLYIFNRQTSQELYGNSVQSEGVFKSSTKTTETENTSANDLYDVIKKPF